jgi:hypothetical protein
VILSKHRFEHTRRGDIERHEDRCAELFGERLDVGLRLLVDIGDREVGAKLPKRLRAAIGNRMLVRHTYDERFGAFEHGRRNLDGHDLFSAGRASSACVCRAIISSSLVGMTQTATPLAPVLTRGLLAALAVASSSIPSQRASRHIRSRRAALFLADPGREDNRIQPTERSCERSQLAADSVNVEVDRGFRTGLVAFEQDAHVAGNARHTEQAGLLIDELLDCACVHLELVEKV